MRRESINKNSNDILAFRFVFFMGKKLPDGTIQSKVLVELNLLQEQHKVII